MNTKVNSWSDLSSEEKDVLMEMILGRLGDLVIVRTTGFGTPWIELMTVEAYNRMMDPE